MQQEDEFVGALSEMVPLDAKIGNMVMSLKRQIERKTGKIFAKFQPKSYSKQVVAGMNYNVLIKTEQGDMLVKIYEPLPMTGTPPLVTDVSFVNTPPPEVKNELQDPNMWSIQKT